MKERQKMLAPYIQALPGILQYQVFTKILLAVWLFLMGRLFRLLLSSAGRVAVSTGDFVFLFTRWQGILIILCALVSMYAYTALDLNAKIILSRDLLSGEKISAWVILKRAVPTIRRFACPKLLGVTSLSASEITRCIQLSVEVMIDQKDKTAVTTYLNREIFLLLEGEGVCLV